MSNVNNNNAAIIKPSKRYVYLTGSVDENMVKDTIQKTLDLESENPNEDILFIINSLGGYVDCMWSIIDLMNIVKCKINTLCIGKAMSAASIILLSGKEKHRYATENSRIMLHQASGGIWGKTNDIGCYSDEIKRMDEICKTYIYKKTKINKKILDEKFNTDWFMSAKEAITFGIIDKIIYNLQDVKIK